MSQGAHLLRIDDLLMLAAFLRTFGTFERVDLLPTGEVDRLDAARLHQSVDGGLALLELNLLKLDRKSVV